MPLISEQAYRQILAVPHFKDSHYARWDLNAVLASYIHCYADPALRMAGGRAGFTIADIGAGYGWLAIAFALRSDARIIASDFDAARLAAAQRIAAILGVEHRIEWRVGALGNLPFVEGEADLACCLEVIEHVSTDAALMHDLSRITRDLLMVSTPNGALPVVFHDTALPFCHWLPLAWRNAYASLFGRLHLQENNRFWNAPQLADGLTGFHRISRFFQYERYADFRAAHHRLAATSANNHKFFAMLYPAYLWLASKLGAKSIYVLPNLASVWRRAPEFRLAAPAQYDLAF
jgi:2-polyprenyl-3-methyl-5-hydroxy-6-metoxy-1,4-benzoquinol methylase